MTLCTKPEKGSDYALLTWFECSTSFMVIVWRPIHKLIIIQCIKLILIKIICVVRQNYKSLDNFLQVNQTWGLCDDNARMLIKSLVCPTKQRGFSSHSHCI